MDLCSWVELLKNGLINIIDLIISRTKNNVILPKKLGVARLELYLGREPRKV